MTPLLASTSGMMMLGLLLAALIIRLPDPAGKIMKVYTDGPSVQQRASNLLFQDVARILPAVIAEAFLKLQSKSTQSIQQVMRLPQPKAAWPDSRYSVSTCSQICARTVQVTVSKSTKKIMPMQTNSTDILLSRSVIHETQSRTGGRGNCAPTGARPRNRRLEWNYRRAKPTNTTETDEKTGCSCVTNESC